MQFTSGEFMGCIEAEGIRVSMDGRGQVYDNIFVERLWRSVKCEEVYLHEYHTVADVRIQGSRVQIPPGALPIFPREIREDQRLGRAPGPGRALIGI